jgi:DNA modification methylase
MRYLVRLVTPPNGVVLDPFAGSGTTGLACQMEGFDYTLIEKDEHNFEICKNRLGLD